MAINKGWDGAILIGTDEISKMNNWEIAFAGDALENTAFGDTVYDRSYQPGLRSHTVTFSGYSEDSNAAQDALLDEMKSTDEPSIVTVVCLYERTTGVKAGWTGSGVITGLTVGSPVDGLAPFSGTIQITGGLATYAT